MRAWVYRKEKADAYGIHIFEEEVPIPVPNASQVLLKVDKVSVCGTDETLFHSDLKKVPDGIIPGHEFYGEIVDLGREVRDLRKGQRVAGESHYNVPGIEDQGIIGLWGPEVTKGELLPPIHGAYAEYLCIPAECAHLVPQELVAEHFWPSLFEAIGNDYFLIKQVKQMGPVRRLGVFGCGPHGLFAQVFARHFDIQKIAAFETDPYRLRFASKLEAADQVFDPTDDLIPHVSDFTGGEWFDVTLDMVGRQGQGFQSCCETTRDGGAIFLFGLFTDRFSIQDIPGNEIIFKQRTLNYEYQGKRLKVVGITGREGIWRELIDTVCRDHRLQTDLMKPVHVMGTLDRMGVDTRNLKPEVMKRAYHAFKKL